ncbi:hypothetical protein MVEN_00107500 [Mycena venus]|uniref:Fungal N-terminal domain-containing protein n=1 Tax=Mycena venus TaxID=2733690 RepID=A0A8H7DEH1_9AGAR|nr:hypothetical protein MVEN_00107500 [Mycena venus]
MAEVLGIVTGALQLLGTVLKVVKVYKTIQGICNAAQEQQDLLSEMDILWLLLDELHTLIAANPSSPALQHLNTPLSRFEVVMKDCTAKLQPRDTPISEFCSQLKWPLWTKEEAREYLEKFKQFETLITPLVLLDVQNTTTHILQSVELIRQRQQHQHSFLLDTVESDHVAFFEPHQTEATV